MNTRTVFVATLLLIFSSQPAFAADPPKISVSHLKAILHDQGFSGALDGDASFRSLGVFDCGANKYRIFYFEWNETRPNGSPGHGQQRIIFIGAGDKYFGSYWIEDPPIKVTRDVIVVSSDANDRDEIRCAGGEPSSDYNSFGK